MVNSPFLSYGVLSRNKELFAQRNGVNVKVRSLGILDEISRLLCNATSVVLILEEHMHGLLN